MVPPLRQQTTEEIVRLSSQLRPRFAKSFAPPQCTVYRREEVTMDSVLATDDRIVAPPWSLAQGEAL